MAGAELASSLSSDSGFVLWTDDLGRFLDKAAVGDVGRLLPRERWQFSHEASRAISFDPTAPDFFATLGIDASGAAAVALEGGNAFVGVFSLDDPERFERAMVRVFAERGAYAPSVLAGGGVAFGDDSSAVVVRGKRATFVLGYDARARVEGLALPSKVLRLVDEESFRAAVRRVPAESDVGLYVGRRALEGLVSGVSSELVGDMATSAAVLERMRSRALAAARLRHASVDDLVALNRSFTRRLESRISSHDATALQRLTGGAEAFAAGLTFTPRGMLVAGGVAFGPDSPWTRALADIAADGVAAGLVKNDGERRWSFQTGKGSTLRLEARAPVWELSATNRAGQVERLGRVVVDARRAEFNLATMASALLLDALAPLPSASAVPPEGGQPSADENALRGVQRELMTLDLELATYRTRAFRAAIGRLGLLDLTWQRTPEGVAFSATYAGLEHLGVALASVKASAGLDAAEDNFVRGALEQRETLEAQRRMLLDRLLPAASPSP